MKNKMAISTHLSQLNLKNKLSKQEQTQNHGYGQCLHGCQMRGWCWGMGEEVKEIRSTNR